jgi:hypothetical protein
VSVIAAGAKGVHTASWWSGAGWVHTLSGVSDLALAVVGWGLLGTLLALALRSPAAAIAVGVAYALPLESILGGVISGASRWLPGKLLSSVAAGGNDLASFSAALVTLTVYAVIAVSVALVVFRRRDVAS